MTVNEKQEAFDKWYDENYDEWAEGEEGIALREELEQAFKSGIATLEKENTELKKRVENQKFFLERIRAKFELGEIDRKEIEGYLESEQLTKAKEIIRNLIESMQPIKFEEDRQRAIAKAEQFLNNSEVEK